MYEYEENSEIIGAHCTLLTPYKGYSEGTVVGDFQAHGVHAHRVDDAALE